jgi:excisionase family DNA binding protein
MHGYIQRLAGLTPERKNNIVPLPIITYSGRKCKIERGIFMQETKSPLPRMRTISEAAKETGVSQHAIRQWVKSGQVPAVYAGNKALINLDRLLDFLSCGGANDA